MWKRWDRILAKAWKRRNEPEMRAAIDVALRIAEKAVEQLEHDKAATADRRLVRSQ